MKIGIVFLVCSLVAGCTHQITRVRSSWYMLGDRTSHAMYISLLNQGNGPIIASEIILNPIRDRVFSDDYHSEWLLKLTPPVVLAPGAIMYARADEFVLRGQKGFGPCLVPIEINLQLDGPRRLVVTELEVAMPNSIPEPWEDCGRTPQSPAK